MLRKFNKPFIVEIKINPFDKWVKFKGFNDLNIANQSFEMLKKHTYNLYKGTGYENYRLHNKIDKTIKY